MTRLRRRCTSSCRCFRVGPRVNCSHLSRCLPRPRPTATRRMFLKLDRGLPERLAPTIASESILADPVPPHRCNSIDHGLSFPSLVCNIKSSAFHAQATNFQALGAFTSVRYCTAGPFLAPHSPLLASSPFLERTLFSTLYKVNLRANHTHSCHKLLAFIAPPTTHQLSRHHNLCARLPTLITTFHSLPRRTHGLCAIALHV
ncbi:hypothetical protein V8E36_007938 [Tilletia maclaganii]